MNVRKQPRRIKLRTEQVNNCSEKGTHCTNTMISRSMQRRTQTQPSSTRNSEDAPHSAANAQQRTARGSSPERALHLLTGERWRVPHQAEVHQLSLLLSHPPLQAVSRSCSAPRNGELTSRRWSSWVKHNFWTKSFGKIPLAFMV